MQRRAMPVKAVAPAPAPSWAGFYIGIVGGYGWTDSDASASDLRANNVGSLTPGGFDPKGGTFGITAGYNWQVANTVLGIEGDYSWSGMDRSTALTVNYTNALGSVPANLTADISSIATVRARLGYAYGNTLWYATGGYATAKASGRLDATFFGTPLSFGDSNNHHGWVIGGGVEAMLMPNWTVKAELLYMDFGDKSYNIGGGNVPVAIDLSVTTVRGGINYKF